jgi:hypothetical protein
MHLGTLLVLLTVILLATEVIVCLSLGRFARQVGRRPGGHFLRVLTRTMAFVVAAQFLDVVTDIALDMAPESPEHAPFVAIEIAALVCVFIAFIWAWWDLTRFHPPH